jgi:hypothetical protein
VLYKCSIVQSVQYSVQKSSQCQEAIEHASE